MFGTHFYHKKVRTCVAVFGSLFNNIRVLRTDASGQVLSQSKVPLSYAPAQKFLERIRSNPNLDTDTNVAIKLPRMSFEILSFTYDATRQIGKINNFNQASTTVNSRNKFNTGVPYIISFQLSIFAKNQDDALQILEQILPYFSPQYSLTMKAFPNYSNVKEDVPIVLQSVDFSDDFEGPVESRRTIIYNLTFDMKVNFYGPIEDKGFIRTAKPVLGFSDAGLNDSDIDTTRIIVTTDPSDASPDSDYGFSTTIEDLT